MDGNWRRLTVRATSLPTLVNGCKNIKSAKSMALRGIRRRNEKSNAGTRRSRTASCSKTTSSRRNSKPRSPPSLSITIIADTMTASTTSPKLKSTSDAARQSYSNAKGSNKRPSGNAAWTTRPKQLKSTRKPSRKLKSSKAQIVSNHSTTDRLGKPQRTINHRNCST